MGYFEKILIIKKIAKGEKIEKMGHLFLYFQSKIKGMFNKT